MIFFKIHNNKVKKLWFFFNSFSSSSSLQNWMDPKSNCKLWAGRGSSWPLQTAYDVGFNNQFLKLGLIDLMWIILELYKNMTSMNVSLLIITYFYTSMSVKGD